jgi:cytoskeletal protein CcmA (bactofilin family)
MALFGKEERTQRPTEAKVSSAGSSARLPEIPSGEESTQAHLGKGSRVEGRLTFEGSVRIDGQIDGEVEAQGLVTIGEAAVINAQIVAGSIIVKGKVNGDLLGRKRVELHVPARLQGNITTPSLVIHEGVVFEGHCSMGGTPDAKTEKGDRKVALFPMEERVGASVARIPSEAAK